MRLGTAYLPALLDQFDGALPLAVAGYNAGPRRVHGLAGSRRRPGDGAAST